MDLPYGSEGTRKFISNVGLITSDGPNGLNVMACEWTNQISYRPGLIVISIGRKNATHENIEKTKEFGVNICATDQNVLSNVAGGNHAWDVDKISVLKDLGFKFYKAEKIKALMIEGAALNAECKLVKTIDIGDHTIFIGEIQEMKITDKEPVIYYQGKYWKIGDDISKPPEKKLEKIRKTIEKYRLK